MSFEFLFSAASLLAMAGWLVLFGSPLIPQLSDKIAGLVIPLLLSAGYFGLLIVSIPSNDGGYGSLAEVATLFSHPMSLLAGWVHFLAFDLLIGAWMCRTARRENVSFWLVAPCLVLTFLFGPVGFLAFSVLRFGISRRRGLHSLRQLPDTKGSG